MKKYSFSPRYPIIRIVLLGSTVVFFLLLFYSCANQKTNPAEGAEAGVYKDTLFLQEFHEAFRIGESENDNNVRSITIDAESNVWIATKGGIYKKGQTGKQWQPVENGAMHGPAYDVLTDTNGEVWAGTWNGLYRFKGKTVETITGIHPPISVLCRSTDGIYALGPNGVWHCSSAGTVKKDFKVARSIRDAIEDEQENLWIATDVGLFKCNDSEVDWMKGNSDFISAYLSCISRDQKGTMWIGGLGGVTLRNTNERVGELKPADGIPSANVNSIARDQDGTMWVGTDVGVVRFYSDSTHSLRFSRRWLINDEVRDLVFDASGNAWIATAGGVSVIRRQLMTLEEKEAYFYDVLMRRHIRDPWIAGQCRLEIAGDTSTWVPEDDDNDGEYTGGYLAMESLRYAVTSDPEALEKARKAFNFMRYLKEVTGTDGFFARTIVPSDWEQVHDMNRIYTEIQKAEELVKDPRNKAVEVRWRKSTDGKWWWKGDTSSDEMDGHMMGYFYFYEFAADEQDKEKISDQVCEIMDYLMAHNYNFVDIDGQPTRWGVWSPDNLNRDPDWAPEQNLNSFELLAFLKFAYKVSGNDKYQNEYLRLIREEGYLNNASGIPDQNPAWFIFFDIALAAYVYPILIFYEEDPELLDFYKKHMDQWIAMHQSYESPLFNFIYGLARKKSVGLESSIKFLKNTPLDLVDWNIDHRNREDVNLVRHPVLEDIQVEGLIPVDIRGTVRWDKNPYAAVTGYPHREREPVFWLLPYWLGRYLGHIQ